MMEVDERARKKSRTSLAPMPLRGKPSGVVKPTGSRQQYAFGSRIPISGKENEHVNAKISASSGAVGDKNAEKPSSGLPRPRTKRRMSTAAPAPSSIPAPTTHVPTSSGSNTHTLVQKLQAELEAKQKVIAQQAAELESWRQRAAQAEKRCKEMEAQNVALSRSRRPEWPANLKPFAGSSAAELPWTTRVQHVRQAQAMLENLEQQLKAI